MDDLLGEKMLEMKKWAVVGATEVTSKFGYRVYKKLKDNGYDVYPVSVKYDVIDGDKAYNSLSEIPEKIEVVDFMVNPRIGISIIKECKELGIKYVWLQPGTVSDEIKEYADNNQIEYFEGCVLVAL